ncbi:uncharacterized protein CG13380 isoform X2 [Copidosoma floridanum]|uniref:uncharacterized protein CG13380 isoform X2 n=1 Tax=Copidosoma floridanum TaxID=29053 RepID=UPI000C6F58D2|nr:uncharacterized protein CG13380 isoform X2 [Copidosoma floridanum]
MDYQNTEKTADVKNYDFNQHLVDRGHTRFKAPSKVCICKRSYQHILCHFCGHLMFGRVRYTCQMHRMTSYLIDITNCVRCKSNDFNLSELSIV